MLDVLTEDKLQELDPAELFRYQRGRIIDLLQSRPSPEIAKAVIKFYDLNQMFYEPHPMGGFAVDISQHLSALEDVLTNAYGGSARRRAPRPCK